MIFAHWQTSLLLFAQVLLAFFLGFLVGMEREYHSSPAGIRTYAAVCMGSCVFALVSTHAQGAAYYKSIVDPTRIAAQIVSGVGFLGAGVIFKDGPKMNGLTTAATIWAVAAIGLAVAFEMYLVAILSTILILILLSLNHLSFWHRLKRKKHKGKPKDEQT
jgi:putative Mg2+ transporter-C (MgtC) family protein